MIGLKLYKIDKIVEEVVGKEVDIKTVLKQLYADGKLEPYIKYIRFPHYKNFLENSRINFDYPITALVGPNGSRKSSVLRALYGCPDKYSVGNYWFNTKIDPIEEIPNNKLKADRHCLVYGYSYYSEKGKKYVDVEVLKARVKRKISKKKEDSYDPDYWEPMPPGKKYGMDVFDEECKKLSQHATRWPTIEKSVLLIDCRQTISAFDRYFYQVKKHESDNKKIKKIIKERTKALKKVIDKEVKITNWHKIQRIIEKENINFSDEQINYVNTILNKKYKSIRLIHHRFFNYTEGYTIYLQSGDMHYSEAQAGSGEFSISLLVYKVMNAKEKSLILLDEPETSLHPGAQLAFMDFLEDRIKINKHQVIISTHSPFIIEKLPTNAIKLIDIDENNEKVKVISQDTFHNIAFNRIGYVTKPITIYVEDVLAKVLLERLCEKKDKELANVLNISEMSGGKEAIFKHASSSFNYGGENVCLFLDGDALPQKYVNEEGQWVLNKGVNVDDQINTLTGVKVKNLLFHLNSNDKNKDNVKENFIAWGSSHIFYLPEQTPEFFLLKYAKEMKIPEFSCFNFEGKIKPKDYFIDLTERKIGGKPSSAEILTIQKELVTQLFENKNQEFDKAIDLIFAKIKKFYNDNSHGK